MNDIKLVRLSKIYKEKYADKTKDYLYKTLLKERQPVKMYYIDRKIYVESKDLPKIKEIFENTTEYRNILMKGLTKFKDLVKELKMKRGKLRLCIRPQHICLKYGKLWINNEEVKRVKEMVKRYGKNAQYKILIGDVEKRRNKEISIGEEKRRRRLRRVTEYKQLVKNQGIA